MQDMRLENYESEDIGDVVIKLEKSFNLKFSRTAFKDIKTFGNLCDVIEAHIIYEHKEDCTIQQAFCKIRKAISYVQQIDEREISLNTELEYIFPRKNRRKQVKKFQRKVGVSINFLTPKTWVIAVILLIFILSLIAFFIDWKIAISGFGVSIIILRLAERFSKELEYKTVRQLTEKTYREHYMDIRRVKGTANRREIIEVIKDTFSSDLDIDKTHLTREELFSWV